MKLQPVPSSGGPRRHRLVVPPLAHVAAPDLTEAQQSVVDHTGGPLLVLGGPGTGKTTALAEAAVRRLSEGCPSDSVLSLTFSRRAARTMRQRISSRLDRTVASPLAFTMHGFCLALLRRHGDDQVYGDALRLLSGPEQEFRVREVLAGTARDSWPERLRPAWDTRAFAAEVRAVLARTRQWGMDPADLVAAGESADRPAWVRVGEFFDEYLDVLDAEQVMDYAELVMRTRIVLSDPAVGEAVRAQWQAVYVDEYQELDPAQTALLGDLVTGGTTVVVAGDPDQSVFGFRGARGRGVLDFSEQFRTRDHARAPVTALRTDHRSAPAIVAASNRVAGRLPLPRAVPVEVRAALRDRQPRQSQVETGSSRGRIEVFTCETAGAEADHIAWLLRQARLHEGLEWTDMAVLVRSGQRTIPALVRTLTAAGVPVEVAGDEIPLASELAVRPLLLALQIASRGREVDRAEAAQLLLSPLGGLDAMGLRRLGRALRAAERTELAGAGLPRPSDDLVRAALVDPELLDDCRQTPEVTGARRLADLLIMVEDRIARRATASEALWLLWSATAWPHRLREQALAGGEAARRADRDLDAVVALFGLAARSEEQAGRRAVDTFVAEVEGQQIPGDTLAEDELRGGAVRVLTAHRAKGHQWPLVVVASVQEGLWPNLRSRNSLLGVDQLTPYGPSEPEPVAARIAEERRLFHVACSRAEDRLVVTAVNGTEGEADQPSRFLTELGVPIRPVLGRAVPRLTLPALVAELRRTAVDPLASTALRRAAAERLAVLATATAEGGAGGVHGTRLVPQADPDTWWGLDDHTGEDTPEPPGAHPSNLPISLSGSQLGSVLECPRRWFLSKRVRAERGRRSAASFGSVVHVLIQHATNAGLDATQLVGRLDEVWHQINFDAVWLSGVERVEAEAALQRFVNWQEPRSGHEVVGVELPFSVDIPLVVDRESTTPDATPDTIRITGTIDRLERDALGGLHVIDFKTGRTMPRADDVVVDPQLGLYQLAVASGAVSGIPAGSQLAGGELVFLRHDEARRTDFARSFGQPSLTDMPWPQGKSDDEIQPTWVHALLARAASLIRAEEWFAMINDGCRYCQFTASCPAQSAGKQVVA